MFSLFILVAFLIEGGVEGEAGEALRCERWELDLRFQIQDRFRWWQVDRVWFDLWFSWECEEVRAQVSTH